MLIRIVNPNTTLSMTEKIAAAARSVAAPGTIIEAVSPTMGPASIEGPYDEAFCLPGLLEEIGKGEAAGCAGHVVACFDDPGVDAARALSTVPVVGIAEAAMHVASMVAASFTVVTTGRRSIPVIEHLAHRYRMDGKLRRVRAGGFSVLDLERPGSEARALLEAEIERAIAAEDPEAVILGCAGMADLAAELTATFGRPVIDGVAAAVKLVEALAGLGVRTSRTGLYAKPAPKAYTGTLARFAPT